MSTNPTNPAETPEVEVPAPKATAAKRRWNLGVCFLLLNTLLVLLWSPLCARLLDSLSLQGIRPRLEPYLLLLGFPTTLALRYCPLVVAEYPYCSILAYVVNMGAVSYFLGQLASWLIGLLRKRPSPSASAEAGPTTPAG